MMSDLIAEATNQAVCPMDHLSESKREAFRSLLTAHSRLLDRMDRELARAGSVPLAWYDVLVTLEHQEHGAPRMSELAERMLLSRSGLTRLVDRLEEQGLVERRQCPSDRRGQHAVVTSRGLQARKEAWPLYSRLIQELFGAQMTDEDAEVVRQALDQVSKAAGGPDSPTCQGRT